MRHIWKWHPIMTLLVGKNDKTCEWKTWVDLCVRENACVCVLTFARLWLGFENKPFRTGAGEGARSVSTKTVVTEQTVHQTFVDVWRRKRSQHQHLLSQSAVFPICRSLKQAVMETQSTLTHQDRFCHWGRSHSRCYTYSDSFLSGSHKCRSGKCLGPGHTR